MSVFQSFAVIISIIILGIIFQRAKVLNSEQIDGFGIFLLKLAMPCYLFSSTIQHDLHALLYTEYVLSFFLTFLIIASFIAILCYRTTSHLSLCIKILAGAYPNAIIYAFPVITFLLKDPTAGVIGNILQIVVIQSIFVTFMSLLRDKEHSLLKKIIMIITTPLILAPIIGIICNISHISPPIVLLQITQYIGNGATSIALFTFGLGVGEVQFNKQTLNKQVISIVVVKNILHPLIAFCVGRFIFALEDYWLFSLIIASSAPTAFVVYLLAKQFQIEELLIKRAVAISSIFSLFSLFLITIVLQSMPT